MAKTKVHGEFLKDSVVRFTAKAGENITKGQAVYISGISGEVPVVSLADANDTAKMPAFGLAEATVSTNAEVEITSFGTLKGLDTSTPGYSLGDILYVDTTAGSLTNNPSGLEATKLQNIGMVQRVHASSGSIKVGGAGRTNAVPNLDDGDIFIGDSNNKAVSDSFTNVLNSEAGINSSADATAITIDSSENVGIGGTPDTQLNIKNGDDAVVRIESIGSESGDDARLEIKTTNGTFTIQNDRSLGTSGALTFAGNTSDNLVIDHATGNLMVGKTADNNTTQGIRMVGSVGFTSFVRDDELPVLMNRLTSNGDILRFEKDNLTVGSIASEGGDALIIQSGTTSGSGLLFHPSNSWIVPARNGVKIDNAIDLGRSANRFKDLYLSGGVVFDAVAGNATSNTLDDYEEGTWTTTISGSTNCSSVVMNNGRYIKIGSKVTLFGEFEGTITATGNETRWQFTIPFSAHASNYRASAHLQAFVGTYSEDRILDGGITNGGSNVNRANVYFSGDRVIKSGSFTDAGFSFTYDSA